MDVDRAKLYAWLRERKIVIEEGFVPALHRYAVQYQKQNGYAHIDEVYHLIGTHKAHVSYWESHPFSTQSKKAISHR